MVIRSVLLKNDQETFRPSLVTTENFLTIATTPVKRFARSFASASRPIEIYISPIFNTLQKRPPIYPSPTPDPNNRKGSLALLPISA